MAVIGVIGDKLRSDALAVVFSLKVVASALAAFYIALALGFERPAWTLTTAFLVAQPSAAAVRSKAVFRLLGTVLGAAAMLTLIPAFVNEPMVLTAALALWLGLCIYLSMLDRTPRSYVFLLGGYTASAIGFTSVDTPQLIFDIAASRVQEVSLGIVVAAVVHGVALPTHASAALLQRLDALLAHALAASRQALCPTEAAPPDNAVRRLAANLVELHQLAVHLPYETSMAPIRRRVLRAIETQLVLLVPLLATIEDQVTELRQAHDATPGPLLAEAAIALDASAVGAVQARASFASDDLPLSPSATRQQLAAASLRARLRELLDLHARLRALRLRIASHAPTAPAAEIQPLLRAASARALHIDHGIALRSALGAIATAWPDGASAVGIAGVLYALFAATDNPAALTMKMLVASAIGVLAAAVYTFVILPRVSDFAMLAAALAPALLLIGALQAKPNTNLLALGAVVGFMPPLGLTDHYVQAPAQFINAAGAQLLGTGFAIITLRLFQSLGSQYGIDRLLTSAWRDVARRAEGTATNHEQWISRMVDRIGLLLPKAIVARDQAAVRDLVGDLRVGDAAGRLRQLGATEDAPLRDLHSALLADLAHYFRTLNPARIAPPPSRLDVQIDVLARAWAASGSDRRHMAMILLGDLQRGLF